MLGELSVGGRCYYRHRVYHPQLGRFGSTDPLGYKDGANLRLAYFVLKGMDPFGIWVWPWDPSASWKPIDTAELWGGGAKHLVPPVTSIPFPGLPLMPGSIFPGEPGGIALPELLLPCHIWNLEGPGSIGRDLVDCFCFGAGVADIIPGIGECPYVEAADCVCNVLTTMQVMCNRNEAWGVAYGALTGLDCASVPIGTAAGVVLGCITGGAIGTPPAPGAGTGIGCILGGLSGGAAGSVVGDILVDIGAWTAQAKISCGGPGNAITGARNACLRTKRRFFGG